MLYEGNNIDEGWDGTYNGQKCQTGTYSWVAFVDFPSEDIITKGKIKLRGTVILLQ